MTPSLPSSAAPPPEAFASDPMRVLQLGMGWLPEQSGNGLDQMYHGLARHLPAVGVGVHGLVAGSPSVAAQSGGAVQSFSRPETPLPRRLYHARQAIRRVLDTHDPSVVAAHFALYAAPGLDLIGDRPLVVHFHGPWAAESSTDGGSRSRSVLKAALERYVYRWADRLIVLSSAFRDVLCQSYGVPPDRVSIVPGGVDPDRFDTGLTRRDARRRLGWPTDRPLLLSVRRLTQRMGLEPLIDAMRTVRRIHPEVLLLIAGKGPLHDALSARIEDLGLQRHVRLLGYVPDADLALAYRAADLSVVPTVALEGFGLITVESLAAGTPVLVTPVGGLPETVQALAPNLILPAATDPSFAPQLAAALDQPSLFPSSAECQQYAREHFSWPTIARRTRSVYADVLK